MPMTKQQIMAEAMALSADDREALAEDLYQSVELEPLSAQQVEELRRRAEAIDRGEVKLIPVDDALRRLRERTRR
jgi:putative addiction module component (TIGR02574 family)